MNAMVARQLETQRLWARRNIETTRGRELARRHTERGRADRSRLLALDISGHEVSVSGGDARRDRSR